MQTAVDCNGSSNSTNSIITTTTTTKIVENIGNDELLSLNPTHSATAAVILAAQAVSNTSLDQAPNMLRHRLQVSGKNNIVTTPATPTSSATITTNYNYASVMGHKYSNNIRLTDEATAAAVEYLGSNVEQMSITPSSSPKASPKSKKKCDQTKLTIEASTITTSTIATTTFITDDVIIKKNGSTNTSSNTITAPVIDTTMPILRAHNVNALMPVSNSGKGGSGDSDNLSTITNITSTSTTTATPAAAMVAAKRNELFTTKMLPLSSPSLQPQKSSSFTSFDTDYFNLSNIASTPLTPSSNSSSPSSNSNSLPPITITTASLSLSSSSTPLTSATPATSTPATTTASPSKSPSMETTMELQLLQWQDMPSYLQFNPYVLKGYRPLQTFKGCLLSLFYWHNETINILTHAIPIVYILATVPGLMPWEKEYRFLSFCHLFGSVAPWCGSFVYHLFMNIEKGENVYYRLLKLDMVGIWVSQSFGALPLVTATTFCFSYKWKWFIIMSYCLLSLWGLYKALTASSPWQRRLCFALPFTMRSILTFLRTLGLVGGSRVALSHVYLQDGVSILGGAIGAMRIPEKWFPGLVDFYLNSHNIMHVLVVVAVYSMHKATIKDFEWMSVTNCDDFTNTTGKTIETTITSNIEL